jgi:hypothetical protein
MFINIINEINFLEKVDKNYFNTKYNLPDKLLDDILNKKYVSSNN